MREFRGNGPVTGKEAEGLLALALGIEHLDGFDPGGLLVAIDLAKVKQGALMGRGGSTGANTFDDTEITVFFAVFLASAGA